MRRVSPEERVVRVILALGYGGYVAFAAYTVRLSLVVAGVLKDH